MQLQLSTTALALPAGRSPVPLAARDAALLAWLALQGPTPRIHLAALLWPDSPPEAARNTLRQRLFQLRRQFGDGLLEGQATLSLATGVTHDLHEAADVLANMVLDWGGDYAAWLQAQRQLCQSRRCQSLAELADSAEQAGDWFGALGHAGELLVLDRLSESAHRRLMRLHYLAGDRAAALQAFDLCEQLLKDELGTRPSPETLSLLATLEQVAPPRPATPRLLPASVMRPPRLIGRERELAQLLDAWRGGQVAAVVGEAGMGKSRLLQAFAEPLSGVVLVAARPGDAGVPYASLARLLRAVVQQPGSGAELPAGVRQHLARVLPGYEAEPALGLPADQRRSLPLAVRALLRSRQGLVGLLLDDLHFADAASLELLATLVDDEPAAGDAAPLRWALAFRPAEAGTQLQALQDALSEQARLRPVALVPLSLPELTALVDSLALPGVDGAALAPGLMQRTGGNPLFVLETLKQGWVEQRLADLADLRRLPRPLSVQQLIGRRIARLTPAALALARVASIAGEDFGVALAEHVLGVPAMALADAMNELEAAQVLRNTRFAHDLVYEAVLASVPAAIAVHTHAAVAAWLAQHGGEPARVATHWLRGGRELEAVPWLTQAAQAAGLAVRQREQVDFLEQRSQIEARLGRRSDAFATLLEATGLYVTLDRDGDHGLDQCARLDALADNPTQRVQALLQRTDQAIHAGHLQEAEALSREGLDVALRHNVAAALCIECRLMLATALGQQQRSAEALPHLEGAMHWIDAHGSTELRCEFHGNLAQILDRVGRLADARIHHQVAIATACELGHHVNQVMTLHNSAANLVLGGLLREGEAQLLQVRRLRAMGEEPSSLDGYIAMLQVTCDCQQGRLSAALEQAQASLDFITRFAPGYRNQTLTWLALCWARLGQWSRFQQVLTEQLGLGPQNPATLVRMTVLKRQMVRALGGGEQLPPLPDTALQQAPPDLRHLGEIDKLGDASPAIALQELQRILTEAEQLDLLGTTVTAHALAAHRAAQLGQVDIARQHLARCEARLAQVWPVRSDPALTWLEAAQACLALADSTEARRWALLGRDWLSESARTQVPEAFRDGYLNRNPVNRQLLALAARLA
jgi:DNA-binding SARP family transcriptional activator